MKVYQAGRGKIFSFPELDQMNIVAIYGKEYTFLCDTYLGPKPMEEVKQIFLQDGRVQPIILFNSHSDWDHVWGNCAFSGSLIIGHEQCRTKLEQNFRIEFEKNKQYIQGDVKPLFPNLLFKEQLHFAEEQLLFFHTPGHTDDSSSCFDQETGLLYTGDNVEAPFPFVQSRNLDQYIRTLEGYLELNPKYIVTGHGGMGSIELIITNLDYLKQLKTGNKIEWQTWNQEMEERHQINLKAINL